MIIIKEGGLDSNRRFVFKLINLNLHGRSKENRLRCQKSRLFLFQGYVKIWRWRRIQDFYRRNHLDWHHCHRHRVRQHDLRHSQSHFHFHFHSGNQKCDSPLFDYLNNSRLSFQVWSWSVASEFVRHQKIFRRHLQYYDPNKRSPCRWAYYSSWSLHKRIFCWLSWCFEWILKIRSRGMVMSSYEYNIGPLWKVLFWLIFSLYCYCFCL